MTRGGAFGRFKLQVFRLNLPKPVHHLERIEFFTNSRQARLNFLASSYPLLCAMEISFSMSRFTDSHILYNSRLHKVVGVVAIVVAAFAGSSHKRDCHRLKNSEASTYTYLHCSSDSFYLVESSIRMFNDAA